MPPLFFNPRKPEIVDIPHEELQQHPSPQDLLPLAELLVAKEFPFTHGDFPRLRVSEWEEETALEVGTAVVEDLQAVDVPVSFSKEIVTRLNILGVFPPRDYFDRLKRFGGLQAFKQQIGVDMPMEIRNGTRNNEYDDLALQDLSDLLLDRYNELVELPEGQRYEGPLTSKIIEGMNRMGLAPGRKYFEKRFDGLRVINDHLGFPDVRSWDEHDYIAYGAAVLRHNGPGSLTYDNAKLLSANKYGPDFETIKARFNWDDFKLRAEQELTQQLASEEEHRQVILQYYAPISLTLPKEEHVSIEEMAQHRAIFLISQHYLNGRSPNLPARLKNNTADRVIHALITEVPGLRLADIETTAITMDIFDDLWPMNHKQRLPILANCRVKTKEPETVSYATIKKWITSGET